jgi:Ni,Fe-hydrogenase I small subunit
MSSKKSAVIWLSAQECTGCTESLLRPTHPTFEKLTLDLISLDYHETVFAVAGHQAESAKQASMNCRNWVIHCGPGFNPVSDQQALGYPDLIDQHAAKTDGH